MNCTSCGSNLPPGSAYCTVCGAPTPYNVSAPAGSYDPTVAASPYGTPPSPSASPAPPPASPTPPYSAPTVYGSPSYNAPANPADPYGNQAPNPYGSNAYTPPPPPVQQPAYVPGQFTPQGQGTQQKPKSRLPLILGIVAGILLLLCVGACGLFYAIGKNASNTNSGTTATTTTNTTPGSNSTPTNSSASPSGQPIDPTAAAIITDAKTSSGVDSNYQPTNPTTTFTVNQDIDVTFNLHLTQPGYAVAKWYDGTSLIHTGKILSLQDTSFTVGYFSVQYLQPTNNGAAELYWCTKADCSDGKLATFVKFTVTGTSSIQSPTGASIIALMDMDRRS